MSNKELLLSIYKFLEPYKTRLFIAALALIAVVSCMLMLGYAIRHFIDNGFAESSDQAPIIYIITLTTIFGFASFIRSYIINTTAEFAANDVKKAAYFELLKFNATELENYSYSDISTRINSDSDYIARVIIDTTSFFLRNSMTTIGGIILMFASSARLSIIAFIIISIITLASTLIGRKVRILAKNAENFKAKITSLVFETILNNKVISAFNKQETLQNHFEIINQEAKNKIIQRLKFRSIFFATVITSMLLTISGIIWYGSIQVVHGLLSAGTLASFIFYAFMTATSFGGIMEMINDQQKNLANCERVLELLNVIRRSKRVADGKISFSNKNSIELKNISYKYNKDNVLKVINDINISIEAGKFTVITGNSGVGKTTILHLLIGLYNFCDGEILIDNKSYKYIDPEMWCGKLAYVPQDNMLFSGTIYDNISFFNKFVDREEVKRILSSLELDSYIDTMPKGIDTDLGSIATKISGGQKQRIAIARALIAKPDILILDEITSQLDESTESSILDFIKKTMNGKTIICVAHRRGAIEKADKVINL